MDRCKDLRAMVNKYEQKKRRNFKSCRKSNNELNTQIEKKFQKFIKNKKRRKTEKEPKNFQDTQLSDIVSKKIVSSVVESVESGEILCSSSE